MPAGVLVRTKCSTRNGARVSKCVRRARKDCDDDDDLQVFGLRGVWGADGIKV
jgi:hypothetical protein